MDFVPFFWGEAVGEQKSSHLKTLYFNRADAAAIAIAVLNSSIFYWWFIALSNCRDLGSREINNFPIGLEKLTDTDKARLTHLSSALMVDLKSHAKRKNCVYKATGQVIYDEFYPKQSKPIIDEIDKILAQHVGLDEQESDLIINYDIKFRLGSDEEADA